LSLPIGRAVTGRTEGRTSAQRGGCAVPGDSGEVVYVLHIAREDDYLISSQQRFQATLYLRRDCGSTTSEMSCTHDPAGRVGIEAHLQRGTYFVTVDGSGSSAEGEYSLRVDGGGRMALDRACDHGEPQSCESLAEFACGRNGSQADPLLVASALNRACTRGVQDACGRLGEVEEGQCGVRANAARALELFDAACSHGDLQSCRHMASVYEQGLLGQPRNPERGRGYLERACNAGQTAACLQIANSFYAGNGLVTAQDLPRALAMYQSVCSHGELDACVSAGIMLVRGEGVRAPDPQAALPLFERACNAHNWDGCNQLGLVYGEGRGVSQDVPRALRYYQQACDGGMLYGCNNIGIVYSNGQGVARDDNRAAGMFAQACNRGLQAGCVTLGHAYENGWGVQQDVARATALYRDACTAGLTQGCTELHRLEPPPQAAPPAPAAVPTHRPAPATNNFGAGGMVITMQWDRNGDNDLHVVTPSGAEIYYGNRSADGGMHQGDNTTTGPEVIRWDNAPPSGTYLVCANAFAITGPTRVTIHADYRTPNSSGTADFTTTRTRNTHDPCSRNSPGFVGELIVP
jgi:TPR repeat protein